MAEKIGVYICEGCGIGAAVNTANIAKAVTDKYGSLCPVVKSVPVACSPECVAEMTADIAASGLDGVCVAACSSRVKTDEFRFGGIMTERVNLREGCVWSYSAATDPDKDIDIDNLALMCHEYTLMGVIKLSKGNIPHPEVPEIAKTILVLGGGWTGLNAALEASKAGSEVILVEKSDKLGGKALNMYKTFPMKAPYDKVQETGIEELVGAVKVNGKIEVKLSTTLTKLSGAPGMFSAEFSDGSTSAIGSVIVAVGFEPADTKYLEVVGYGKYADVMTSAQFEAMAKAGPIVRKSDGKPATSVAFILSPDLCCTSAEPVDEGACAGEAAPAEAAAEGEAPAEAPFCDLEVSKHLPYSSELNSLVALKQAGYVREKNADAMAYIFYDHMMVPGINERYYRAAQDDSGIMLTKTSGTTVTEQGGRLSVLAKDTLIGGDLEIEADIVVFPSGIVPTTAHEPVLNLEYRQGLAFPDLALFDGYADSNYICFPYESRRTGIYAAGCVRAPMTMALSAEDAKGAALKAMQAVNSANRGVAVHPRSGDLSYPVFNFVRCTQCKRCTEECPFGALDDDPKGTPMPNPSRCRRCGTCMGACPERVISFDNYNVDMIGSMIREMGVPPDMKKGGPRVLMLVCENDALPAMDMAAFRGKSFSPYVRYIPVRCLGSVNAIWVADAMSKGIDGVMMLGCKYGDDYQCHFVKGSELCNRRKENIAESLKRLGVEPERVEQFQVSIDEYDKLPGMIEAFMADIVEMGPNPFKGY